MDVKVKVNAFSYQRYGPIQGELEYISPTTTRDPQTKQGFYTARVGLEKDYFLVNEEKTPVRYGMGADAEITVRKRRIIDLVLDPMRNIAG
jgi:HlyD family secretion protein